MRFRARLALAALAVPLAFCGCGIQLDVSRISGVSATFFLPRRQEEAILTECRLVVPPSAVVGHTKMVRMAREFAFRGETLSVAIDVDTRIVEASRAIWRERCVITAGYDIDDFYEAVVFDPAEEPFFEALLAELRGIRAELSLDDAGYAEMLVAFVQSLEYQIGESLPKHPIAAFADAEGDCDEKSALLAGLLAREGYDVCLLLFPDAGHMAVGLRAPRIDYRYTGYAYVETTARSAIGVDPFGEYSPTLRVIEIGNGDLEYAPDERQEE